MIVVTALMMIVWVGASVIVSQLAVGYLMLWMLGSSTFREPVPTAIYSALSYVLAMVMIIMIPKLIKAKRNKNKNLSGGKKTSLKAFLEELGIKGWPTWADIGLAPLGMLAYMLLATGLVSIFNIFPWFNAQEVQDVGFSTFITGFDRLIAFFTIVIIAPIAEEIIFRGWLYGNLKNSFLKKCSKPLSIILANFLVSLAFGIIHLQWNVGVNVFAMSIVLCGLSEITGAVYSGIILHMLKNGIAFYLVYVLGIQ